MLLSETFFKKDGFERIGDEPGGEHEHKSPCGLGKDRMRVANFFLRPHGRNVEVPRVGKAHGGEGDYGNDPAHDETLREYKHVTKSAWIIHDVVWFGTCRASRVRFSVWMIGLNILRPTRHV